MGQITSNHIKLRSRLTARCCMQVVLDEEHQRPIGLLPPAPVSFSSGLCFCHLNRKRNRIHRIQTAAANRSTLEFIGAEVLERPSATSPQPLAPHPCYQLEDADHPRARTYRVTVQPGCGTGPVEWGFCGVVIALGGRPQVAAFSSKHLLPGAAFWFEGPVTVDVVNEAGEGGRVAELLVVEWC